MRPASAALPPTGWPIAMRAVPASASTSISTRLHSRGSKERARKGLEFVSVREAFAVGMIAIAIVPSPARGTWNWIAFSTSGTSLSKVRH